MIYRLASWIFFVSVQCVFPVYAQQAGTIRILDAETLEPIENVIVVMEPMQKSTGKKQLIAYSNQLGEVINMAPSVSICYFQILGYQNVADTIEPFADRTIFLQKSAINLGEVVVTGQYDINTSDKSVYSILVIDREAIQSMAAQDLGEVLAKQLNCRIEQDNILGSSVSINGLSGQHVKILVDGISLIGRENGNVDLNQINMSNVERIEVIEGPMSVSYGTDAIGGVVNVVTRKSSSYPFQADVNLYYESSGTYNGDGALMWRINNTSLLVSGGRYFFDGFHQSDTSRYMQWKPRQQYFAAINYNYTFKSFQLNVKSDFLDQTIQNKGNPVVTPYQAYAFDDYYLTRRWNSVLNAEWRFKNNAKFQISNGYSYYRHIRNTYRMDMVNLEEVLLTSAGSQDTAVFNNWSVRGTYSQSLPNRKLNYQAGYDVNLETGSGQKLAEGTQHINDYALFGSLEYQAMKQFFIRPGVRFSYNSRYGAPFTPSLNLKYDFNVNYSLRASYAHGFRAPSLKELDLYFVDVNHNVRGNPELEAESSDNFTLSLATSNTYVSLSIRTDVTVFYNHVNNIITLALVEPVTQLYTYINIDRYKTTGGSFSATFSTGRITYTTGFSLTGLYNSVSDSFDIDQFSMTPEFLNNFLLTFPKAGMEGAVFFKSTGSTPGYALDTDGTVYQTFIGPYSMIDLSLTKAAFKKHVSFSIGVKNLLNVVNIQSTSTGSSVHSSGNESMPYATGRFFFGTVRMKLYKDE